MEPFGKGNEAPTFAEKDLTILRINRMGKEQQYLRFELRSANGFRFNVPFFGDSKTLEADAIRACGQEAWNRALMGLTNDMLLQIIYTPSLGSFRGEVQINYRLKQYQFVKKS